MDLYSILEVDQNSTPETIKKAYFRLAKKWHPDKNQNKEIADKKFKEICYAYEILSDVHERRKYDKMNNEEKMDFYIVLNQLINKYKDNFVLKYFYPNIDEFANDINNNDFEKMSDSIMDILKNSHILDTFNFFINKNIKNNISVEPSSESENHFLDVEDCRCFNVYCIVNELDIKMDVNVNLFDVYSKKKMTISVKRELDGSFDIYKFRVPLIQKYAVFFNYGDSKSGKSGNLIFKINVIEDIKIDKFDIILDKMISVKQLLYGDNFEIDFCGVKWEIQNFEPLKNSLKFVFSDFGLPMSYDDDERGDLVINFIVDDEELIKDKNKYLKP